MHAPSVEVDGEQFVVVDVPVFALADELSEQRERDVFGRDSHFLTAISLQVMPVAVVGARKPTLGDRRRQQICADSIPVT